MATLRYSRLALALAPLGLLAAPPQATPALPTQAASELLASARLWEIKGRDDLARLALEKLLRSLPGDRGATARLAVISARSGRLDEARATLQRLSLNGPVGPAIRNLDNHLRLLG
ncbi:tetratricopeptide repeat protein, partial [Chitinimonas sp.]|uniref:tetratricopeptide repeat protein n=1 Tax=Chitinimonas sp. TaxID=1934313 RepID=UPI0035B23A7A